MNYLGIEACECSGKYIFVSYAHDDAPYISQIVKKLHERGIRIWYDAGIPEGENWVKCLTKALDGCNVVVAFLSKSFVSSDYCYSELALAQKGRRPKIPVLIEETEISDEIRYVVSSAHYVNQYLYYSVDQIVDALYPLIMQAFSGIKSDYQVSSMQMKENIDVLIQHESWDFARKEAILMTTEDSQNYMSWYCQFRVFTRDKSQVSCVEDKNNLIGFSINRPDVDTVFLSYREAYRLSSHNENERKMILDRFVAFRDNYDRVNNGITKVNKIGKELFELKEYTRSELEKNEVSENEIRQYCKSIFLYFSTSIIESLLFVLFLTSSTKNSISNDYSSGLSSSVVLTYLVIFLVIISIGTLFVVFALSKFSHNSEEITDEELNDISSKMRLFKFTFSPVTMFYNIYVLLRSLYINFFICNPLKNQLNRSITEYEKTRATTIRDIKPLAFF